MLDAFKRKVEPQDALLADIRREKTELAALLAQVTAQISRLETAAQTASATAEQDARKQRQAAEILAAQSLESRATLDALAGEREALNELRREVQQAVADLHAARAATTDVSADLRAMRDVAAGLVAQEAQLRAASRDTREDAEAAAAAVREVESKVAGLARLQDVVRTLDERVTALNAMAEHVTQKARVLEQQKQTMEQAIVGAHRLGEMVATMNGQMAAIEANARQAQRAEEQVNRVEQLVRESGQQLDDATRRRESFLAEVTRLDAERIRMQQFVAQYAERLAADRREMDGAQGRLSTLQDSVTRLTQAHEALALREQDVHALAQRLTALDAKVGEFATRAEEAGLKVAVIESIRTELLRLDEMARRAEWQMESLKGARQDLEDLRADIQAFYKEHGEASQLRDRLAADRTTLEAFLDRAGAFAATMPELDARLNAVREKLSTVDEGTQKAANLVAIADNLDKQMTRLAGYQQFVERIEGRMNALTTLTADVDRRLDEQIARRAEIDALRSLCDGVGLQVTDLRQKLEGVSQTQATLLPITSQVAELRAGVERAQTRLASALRDERELVAQETRIAGMLESVRRLAAEAAERVAQGEGLTAALDRSTAVKDALLQELTVVQGRQRDVAGQLVTADHQIAKLDQAFSHIESRREQVAFAERRMGTFEGRLRDLEALAGDVEARMEALTGQAQTLDALRSAVDGVHEVAARSRADLDQLEAQRGAVSALRNRVDELLATARATDERLADINARRRLVDEVQLKVNVITSMLEDVRVNLETVSEQRAVLDHVMTRIATLDGMTQQAQSTLKALQAERELAERIEQGIRTLRTRTAVAERKQA